MKKFIFIIILFCSIYQVSSQSVLIKGNAPDYKGDRIYVYSYTDWITKSEEDLGFFEVDQMGDFSFKVNINETRLVYFSLYAYKGYLYISPNYTYEILLPPKKEKDIKEKLNPYFIESEIHLGVINCWKNNKIYEDDELNFLINSFDYSFDLTMNEYITKKYFESMEIDIDSIIEKLSLIYQSSDNNFFNEYKKYKIGYLKYTDLVKKGKEYIINEYFIDLPILYENPAYMNLFQHLFERYLFNYNITNEQRPEIESALLNNNFKKLFESFNLIGNTTNSNLKELVLLKEIHDGLYTNYYPRRNLIQILDSIFFYSQIAEHKYIAQNIREKITRLLPGFKPPDFSLRDEDSIYYSLSDFRGKFVYLCFCNIQSLSCIKEFNILDSLQQRYKEYLYVIMISVDENFENTIYYKEKKQLDLNFFHYGNNPIILKKYNVKAFPTYYLIDPDGKLILSPAPSPSQDFEIKLFQILRSNGFL